MKKQSLLSLFLGCIVGILHAQQSLVRGPQVISPYIHTDKTVTFRLVAPDAKEVRTSGEWMPVQGFVWGSEALAKGDSGVWSYTTSILPSELYTYSFTVDGVRGIDPGNAFVIRDVASITSYFIIDGQKGDYYKVANVPHGSMTRRWYDSPGNTRIGGPVVRRVTVYTPPVMKPAKQTIRCCTYCMALVATKKLGRG